MKVCALRRGNGLHSGRVNAQIAQGGSLNSSALAGAIETCFISTSSRHSGPRLAASTLWRLLYCVASFQTHCRA
jgi:hypothetical protein